MDSQQPARQTVSGQCDCPVVSPQEMYERGILTDKEMETAKPQRVHRRDCTDPIVRQLWKLG